MTNLKERRKIKLNAESFNVIQKDLSNSSKVGRKYSQSFTSVVPTFQLDEKNYRLVETGFKDVQKEIDSFKGCALDVMLDKFLERESNFREQFEIVESEEIIEKKDTLDLVELGEALEVVDLYKEKYNLPLSMDPKEVFTLIKEKEFAISDKIKKLNEGEEKNES